jgi:hypothetical protein
MVNSLLVRIACVAAVLFGAYELVLIGQWNLADARLEPGALQLKAWGPMYAFARACADRTPERARILLVDPTDRLTGATIWGFAPDVDLNDVRAFEYVMYPRGIAGIGHVPSDWQTTLGQADDVALWASADNGSAALAQADVARADITQLLSAPPVCTYDDGLGHHGDLFALTPFAGLGSDFTPLDTVQSSGGGGAYLRTLVGLGSLWLIGIVLLGLLKTGGWQVRMAQLMAFALPVGCVAVTLELLVSSLIGLPWRLPMLLLPWCALGLWLVVAARRDLAELTRGWQRQDRAMAVPLGWDERLVLVVLVVLAILISLAAVANLPQSDGFHVGYFQARAFFVDGGVAAYYSRAQELVFSANAHPPLVPLSVTWLYLINGAIDERATLLLWPAWWASLIGAAYVFARSVLRRRVALWCVLIFAIAAYDLSTAAFGRAPDAPNRAGFADFPLATYLFLGAGVLWWGWPSVPWPLRVCLLAGTCLVGAGLTKEEGSLAAVLVIGVSLLVAGYVGRPKLRAVLRIWWRPAVALGLTFVVGMLPWFFVRIHYALPEVIVQANRSAATLAQAYPVSLGGMLIRALPRWILPTTVLVVVWSRLRTGSASAIPPHAVGRMLFPVLVTLLQFAADTVALTLGPNEIHEELIQAAQRVLVQLVPLPFLAAIDAVPILFARAPETTVVTQPPPVPSHVSRAGTAAR